MDTNSIQPVKNLELEEANTSEELSFAKGYLRTTNALGVWPISLVSSLLTLGLLAVFIDPTSLNFAVVASNSLSGFFVVIFSWLLFSWFRWPLVLKVVFSTWAAILAGVLPHILIFQTTILPMHPSLAILPYLQGVFAICGIPSLVISVAAITPYLVTELLEKKCLLSEQIGQISQINEDGREQT